MPQLLFNSVVLSLCTVQFGFLGHDAAHRQLAHGARVSRILAVLLWNALCGISASWWEDKHRRHHRAPNVLGEDPDLYDVFVFRPDELAGRPAWRQCVARYQAWLFLPLVACTGVYFQALSLWHVLKHRPRFWGAELGLLIVRHSLLLLLAWNGLGVVGAAAFLMIYYVLTGLYLGAVFSSNHYGLPVLAVDTDLSEPARTLMVTRNVRVGRLGDYLYGGLNYQIEHHLQPGLPRRALREAAARTKLRCLSLGLPYHETDWWAAMKEVLVALNALGRHRPSRPSPEPYVAP